MKDRTVKHRLAPATSSGAVNLLRTDPTRTGSQVRAFVAQLRARFARLKGRLHQLVVTEDAFSLKQRAVTTNEQHRFATVQLDVDDSTVTAWVRQLQETIDPADALKLENRPHVTVRYGLLPGTNPETIEELLAGLGPVTARLGGLSLFRRPDQDVLKLDVFSPQLHQLNRRLGLLPHNDLHPNYRPHLTVAYLKPGTGDRYLAVLPPLLTGLTLTAGRLTYSSAAGAEATVALNAFCPTGQGGGVDPHCSPGGTEHGPNDPQEGKPLTADEHDALLSWTKNTWGTIRKDQESGKQTDLVRSFEAGLRKLPYVTVRSYRGVTLSEQELAALKPGQHHMFEGPESFSKDRDWAEGWAVEHPSVREGRTAVVLVMPPSRRVRDLGEFSGARQEEVVVQPKTLVKVTHREEHNGIPYIYFLGAERVHNSLSLKDVVGNSRFAFRTDPQKVEAFQEWLAKEYAADLTGADAEALWDRYVQEGFKKGAARAWDDTHKVKTALAAGDQRKLDVLAGEREGFLRHAFAAPETVEKAKLLAGQAFDDMEGVTEAMSLKMSRILTDGLVQGQGPLEVAKSLAKEVDLSLTRAETVARTSLIYAHAEGQLLSFETLGVAQLGVMVEFATAGDVLTVCEKCASLRGVVVKINQAHGIIPVHPRCRCCWQPVPPGMDAAGQKTGRKEIAQAFSGAGLLWPAFNSFCPTGKGGSVKATCGKDEGPAGGDGASLHAKATAAARRALDGWNKGYDAVTDRPVLKQLRQAGEFSKKLTGRLYGVLERRYGRAQAVGIMASAQLVGWGSLGVGAAIGVPLYLPGVSLWGALPAAALAEGYLQARHGTAALGHALHLNVDGDDVGEMSDGERDRLATQLARDLGNGYLGWLKANRLAVAAALKEPPATNTFCPTGEGGGVDPTCGRSGKKPKVGSPEWEALMDEATRPQETILPVIETAAFKEFFAGSVVKDARGSPRKMYHGTEAELSQFEDSKSTRAAARARGSVGGISFTTSRKDAATYGDNIHEVYLRVVRPAPKDVAEAAGWNPEGLKKQGYDGFQPGTKSHWVVFDPEQVWHVKSRVGNAFCATGEGGGVDPHCGKGGGASTMPPGVRVWFNAEDGAAAQAALKQRHGLEPADVARLVGAQPGAIVTVVSVGRAVHVKVEHDDYRSTRYIYSDHVENDRQDVFKTGTGLGTKIFADQVAAAAEHPNLEYISTHAGRSAEMNGYYTWARLGFDGALDESLSGEPVAKFPPRKPANLSISDLLRTPEGRAWWKEHGDGFTGTFDLKEGSLSRKVLEDYVAEKKRMVKNEATDLAAADEAILDRVWDRLRHFPGTNRCFPPTANVFAPLDAYSVNVFCATGEGGGVDPSCGVLGPKGMHTAAGAKALVVGLNKATGLKFRVFGSLAAGKRESMNDADIVQLPNKEAAEQAKAKAMHEAGFAEEYHDPVESFMAGHWFKKSEELDQEVHQIHRYVNRKTKHIVDVWMLKNEPTSNVFCPTGEGGGVDATCSPHHPHARNQPNPLLPDATRPPVPTPELAQHLTDYSWGYDGGLNKALRETGAPPPGPYGGDAMKGKPDRDGPAIFEALRGLLARAVPFGPPPVTVYRGIDPDSAEIMRNLVAAARQALKTGGVVTMPGFVSTTTAADSASDGPVQFRIAAVHGLDLRPYSKHPTENELLLDHNARYRVTGVKSGKRDGDDYHVISLEQLPPDHAGETSGELAGRPPVKRSQATMTANEKRLNRMVGDADEAQAWAEAMSAAPIGNVFCATGEGGGVNPHCGSGGSGAKAIPHDDAASLERLRTEVEITFPEGPRREEALHALKPSKWDVVIATHDAAGRLAGVAQVWKTPDTANSEGVPLGPYVRLRNMATARSGQGAALLDEVKRHAAVQGAGVYLSSLEGSRPFYEKHGFHEATGSTYYLTAEETAGTHNTFCPTGLGGGVDPSCSFSSRPNAGVVEQALVARLRETYGKLTGPDAHLLPDQERERLKGQYQADTDRLHGLRSGAEAIAKPVPKPLPTIPFPPRPAQPAQPVSRPAAEHVDTLVRSLTRAVASNRGNNFVDLTTLRAAHPDWGREHFDAVLQQARQDGKITLQAQEGRHLRTKQQRVDAVVEHDDPTGMSGASPTNPAQATYLYYASLRR